MKVGYVVLYVQDEKQSLEFWTKKVGMIVKKSQEAAGFQITRVGFKDQDFSFELVPLKLMENNPDGLNLGIPSICFTAPDLVALHTQLKSNGVKVTDIANHFGTDSFAFSDSEDHYFAAIQE
ncbi:MAG TPA: VOC family protein [Leptospiraceae bacterium]|nr:VOC family protein [Leptospiraceae bacterium]HMW06223.1 VOC family protein [Leptospiraceae bacterium]HMX34284.1 VOC family protein [Leptospiraceae bacterium]HMY31685.1 VOC family protein [Leptospiraceae bacterium]HMZ67486.1 VOC family protein [Leptospiraceae bacterium]